MVQPLLVSTVVVVDMLVGGCWLLGVFLVEFENDVSQVFDASGWVLGSVGIWETGPLDSILDLVSVTLGVEDFFYFPLLLFLDDNRGGWWLVVSRDRFCTGCGFEEADMDDWVDFDSGR